MPMRKKGRKEEDRELTAQHLAFNVGHALLPGSAFGTVPQLCAEHLLDNPGGVVWCVI